MFVFTFPRSLFSRFSRARVEAGFSNNVIRLQTDKGDGLVMNFEKVWGIVPVGIARYKLPAAESLAWAGLMSVSVSAKVQQTDIVSLPLPLCQRDAGVAYLLSGSGLPAALTHYSLQGLSFRICDRRSLWSRTVQRVRQIGAKYSTIPIFGSVRSERET